VTVAVVCEFVLQADPHKQPLVPLDELSGDEEGDSYLLSL
jgi:hypothetical protein